MSNVTSGVKIYTESPTLLQYQPKKEFTQEDTPYLTQKRHQLPAIESNPSILKFNLKVQKINKIKYLTYIE